MTEQDGTANRPSEQFADGLGGLLPTLETVDIGIFVLDPAFTVEWINETAATYFGLSRADVIGQDKQTLIESTIASIFERPERFAETVIDTYRDNSYVEEFECHVLPGEGRAERWLRHQSRPIRSGPQAGGRIEHYADITDLKESQQRLAAQRDDLEVLNQVLRHDIRNDLQLVTAYAEMLAPHVDETGEAHRKRIVDSADNAIGLTESARDLADVMRSRQTETTSVVVSEVLDTQIAEVQAVSPAATITVAGPLPETAVVATSLLGSVVRNLLTNAIQHNRSEEPRVTVSATERDGWVEIRVADNGPGIPDSQKAELFGKGEKGLESAGTGIGLYLVRTLVESYDGEVRVQDNEPEGAVFVVDLPVAD
ncbi:MAG: PAS domain-containing sensor histidine kinase [Euryarchaeota archaeon]|nr:PAS domain-containing sensor histidine kinase [Euryarchaeota archaeon]